MLCQVQGQEIQANLTYDTLKIFQWNFIHLEVIYDH